MNPPNVQFNVNEYQQPIPIASQNAFQHRSLQLQDARALYNNNKYPTNLSNINSIKDPESYRKNRLVKYFLSF